LINEPFGRTYDIVDKKLKVVPPRTLAEVGESVVKRMNPRITSQPAPEDTDATNELINDGEFVQPLTLEEIQALKQSGAHASVGRHFIAPQHQSWLILNTGNHQVAN
jgi:tRNA (adenine-N(1)-)-methyltransferase non-catalytic subunit